MVVRHLSKSLFVMVVLLLWLAPLVALADSPSESGSRNEHEENRARSSSEVTGERKPAEVVLGMSPVLTEGFEVAVMPPMSWTQLITNTSIPETTWYHETKGPHTGTGAASIQYDEALVPQDEWLVSPELSLVTGTLSFWSNGSLFWCRDTNDNCDLNVYLVVGEVGGGDDIYVGTADADWTVTFEWAQSTFDLTPLLPAEPVRLGFQYLGLDGAQVSLDDIVVDGTVTPPTAVEMVSLGASPATARVPWLLAAATGILLAAGYGVRQRRTR